MIEVAVITRTKDRGVFLRRAIESVSGQIYKNYTHVILNDGGESALVDSLVESFPESVRSKIKVFHRAESSGAPDTLFNEAISKVNSEYIAIHDDDDTWHPDFLEMSVKALKSGFDGVVSRTDNVYEKIEDNSIKRLKTDRYMPEIQAISLYRQCLDNQLTAIAFVYSRRAYDAVGGYDDSLPVVGDWEFGIRFLTNYDVEYLDPGYALAFYHRRLQKDNSFSNHSHRKNITKVFNKYLRQDIESGNLGIGYIMNDLRYQQDFITANIKRLMPSFLSNYIKRRVRK